MSTPYGEAARVPSSISTSREIAFSAFCGYARRLQAMQHKAKTKARHSRKGKRASPGVNLAELCVRQWRSRFEERYLPRIVGCLDQLSDEEIWWRPNAVSNSIGNLVLHICGNMRQWIIAGLGGAPDLRQRDKEFAERGPVPTAELRKKFEQTVKEACGVMARLAPGAVTRRYRIQGYDVTGYEAAAHVIEHVAYHAGQIIYVTKLKRARDLGFTKLPSADSKANERRHPV